jgi:hypothetical protein
MASGNLICQLAAEKKRILQVDFKRVLRYSSFGFFISVKIVLSS